MNRTAIGMLQAGTLLLVSMAAGAEGFESLATYKASEVVPPDLLQSDNYTVDESVAGNGYLYEYVMRSRFGNYEVAGESLLRIRAHELDVLAQLAQDSKTGIFVDSALKNLIAAGQRPFELAGSLLTRPVSTVTGIPAGIGRFLSHTASQAGSVVSSSSSSDTEGKVDQAVGYGEQYLGISDAQRRWAKELQVDPYSSNMTLRAAIKEAAKYDAAAGLAVGLAIPSIPGVGIAGQVNSLVWDLDPTELKKRQTSSLVDAGADPELIEAFFDNPRITPTLATLVVQAALSMEGVSGRQLILERLGAVASDEEARFATESILLLARAHAADTPVVKLRGETAIPVGVTASGTQVIFLALDHVTWTEDVAGSAAPLLKIAVPEGNDIYITGTFSEQARSVLNDAGWRTHERIPHATF